MKQKIDDFVYYLKNQKRMSDNTVISYKRDLTKLYEFFLENGITNINKVTSTNINSYMLSLEKQGKTPATIARNISSINAFFKFLLIRGEVSGDPTDLIKAPKVEKRLPQILENEEIEALLAQPLGKSKKEIRDKALLELLCATGIRVSELIGIKIEDVNVQLGYLVCKGDKRDRVIPFGNKAKVSLSRYIHDVLENEPNKEGDLLFLNCYGKRMSRQGVWKIIKSYADKAGIKKDITPHMLRHSVANNLLKNGKSIKEVQEIMGHTDVISTTIYLNT